MPLPSSFPDNPALKNARNAWERALTVLGRHLRKPDHSNNEWQLKTHQLFDEVTEKREAYLRRARWVFPRAGLKSLN